MEYTKFEEYGQVKDNKVDLQTLSQSIISQLDDEALKKIEILINKEQDRIDKESIPHYAQWSKAGNIERFIQDQTEIFTNSQDGDLLRGTFPLPDRSDGKVRRVVKSLNPNGNDNLRKSLLNTYKVTQNDLDRYYKVQSAFKEFNQQELLKSMGKGAVNVTFKEAMEGYLKSNSAKNLRVKSLNAYKKGLEDFCSIYGAEIDLRFINKNMAKDFINKLENHYNSNRGKPLSNSTIGTKVTAVRLVLSWAENQAWDYTNTWTGISLAKRGIKKRNRDRFRHEQLVKLFSMEMPEHIKLIFRILVCTGFRLEECIALEKSDIYHYENVYIVDLTSPNKILKTEQSARRVPVHPTLELYLKPYIDTLDTEKLFPNFALDKDGKGATAASKVLMKYIKQVRTHKDQLLDNHSFRQTFRQKLNNTIGFTDAMIDYIGGWEFKGMGVAYNVDDPFEMSKLAKLIGQIDFIFIKS